MRPAALFERDELIGSEVAVDIYEPLRTSRDSSLAGPGEVSVSVTGLAALMLVGGAIGELPALRPPIRVRGVLRRDAAREARSGRTWRLIEVSAIETLEYPAPAEPGGVAAVIADPVTWHGRYVTVDGTWVVGFEASYLDKELWLDFYPDAEIRCDPPGLVEYQPVKVRATGYIYTEGGHYGHLGMAKAKIRATELVYLDPRAPACKL